MTAVPARRPRGCVQRALRALVLPCVLALQACAAGYDVHREGLAMIEEGRIEDGLGKLDEAARADPANVTYRRDLARNREQATTRLLASAAAQRGAQNWDAAQVLYERVLQLDPHNSRAAVSLQTLPVERRHEDVVKAAADLLRDGRLDAARAVLQPVLAENPRHIKAQMVDRQIDEEQMKLQLAAPSLRERFKKPVTLQFRDGNLKMVFEAISRTTGLNILLDRDIKPDVKTSIFVKDVSVEDALDLILLQTQLDKKVISDNTVFIYPVTPAKQKDYQDLKIRSFHLVNADPKQMLAMIKTLLKTKDIFVHEKTNSIVMRDTPDAIRLAEKLIADQDMPDPEVMLELEVLEVSRTRLSEIGIKYPDSFTLRTPQGADGRLLTLGEMRDLSTDSLIATPLGITLNLKLQDGSTNLLASPRIRARNREKAKILIGDRVPVITNAVTPVSTGTPVITGSVQYLDVGLKLDIEPDIQADNEVAIKVNLEVSSIVKEIVSEESGSLAYQIGTRNASTVLRLRDGETQVLAGLISDEDRNTASKVPGLGQLPVLGRLFSSHANNGAKTEIILSITPRVVGSRKLPDARLMEYWSGTEASLRSQPLALRSFGTVAASASPGPAAGAVPATPAGRPTVSSVARSQRRAVPGVVMPAVPAAPDAADAPASASAASAGDVPPAPPFALVWDGPAQARVGDKVSVTLRAQAAQGVNSVGMLVGFDPGVLRPADVVEGDLLKLNSLQPTFNRTIDPAGGQILVDWTGAAGDAVSGQGSVVTLTFEVIGAKPQSQLTVSRIAPTGPGGDPVAFSTPEPHTIAIVK